MTNPSAAPHACPRRRRRAVGRLLTLLWILPAAGCASAGMRPAIVRLADAGRAAATATAAEVSRTRNALEPYLDTEAFLAPLADREPPSPAAEASIAGIRTSLALRVAAYQQLASAYAALGAYASYDAGAEVERAVNGLAGSVNAYATAVGGSPLPALASWAATKASGGWTSVRQLREMRAASAAIRERLERFQAILDRERTVFASVWRTLTASAGESAVRLFSLGLGAPTPILVEQTGSFGLVYDEKHYADTLQALRKQCSVRCLRDAAGHCAKDCTLTRADDLTAAVRAVIDRRIARQVTLQNDALTQQVEALAALRAQHVALEAGREPDVTAVEQQVASLRASVEELITLKAR